MNNQWSNEINSILLWSSTFSASHHFSTFSFRITLLNWTVERRLKQKKIRTERKSTKKYSFHHQISETFFQKESKANHTYLFETDYIGMFQRSVIHNFPFHVLINLPINTKSQKKSHLLGSTRNPLKNRKPLVLFRWISQQRTH